MIVGFNFNKIVAERKTPLTGKISINNNVRITDVSEQSLALGKIKQAALKFDFEFSSSYNPGVGEIKFIGDIIDLEEESKAKEIVEKWKKEKRLDKDLMTVLINHVLNKCNIKALVMSQEINLPPPIPLPKVQAETKPEPAVKPAPKPAASVKKK
jgi:hypothetical protein